MGGFGCETQPTTPATTTAPKTTTPATTTAPKTTAAPTTTTPWEPPKVIYIGNAGGTGTTGHTANTGLVSGITDVTGMDFRITVSETSLGALDLLRSKQVSFLMDPAHWTHQGYKGLGDYNITGWGPQSVRLIYMGGPLQQALLTRADANIKTGADMKGKNVAYYLTSSAQEMTAGLLAYFDESYVEYEGLNKTEVSAYGDGLSGLIEGTVDVARASLLSGPCYELEASSHGSYFIPMPASDTEGWARFQKYVPYAFPSVATVGAGLSEDNPLECMEWAYMYLTYDWQDEDLVYWYTKQIRECYDAYKDKHSYLESWTWERAFDIDRALVPFHPGAIKYFEEQGVWGAEQAAWQKAKLAEFDKILEDWKQANPGLESVPN